MLRGVVLCVLVLRFERERGRKKERECVWSSSQSASVLLLRWVTSLRYIISRSPRSGPRSILSTSRGSRLRGATFLPTGSPQL